MYTLICLSLIPPLLLLLYPLTAWLRFFFFRKKIMKDHHFQQAVTIIIAAYNEENVIRQKIESFLDAEEWIEGSEIIVTSTGSTDGTNAILQELSSIPAVHVIISPVRISKISAVNHSVELAKHALLVFSDCRQKMKKGSVKAMVANFSDPAIGTVGAVLHDRKTGQSFFRRKINALVWLDSQYGSGLNVYGALYAQRKSIFKPFPDDLLFDDLYVTVSTMVQQKRLIQERDAVIYDVNFRDYYQGERLQRLTRGLLIFLITQRHLLKQLKFAERYRFFVFKYVKLLLPFSAFTLLSCILWLSLSDVNFMVLSIFGAVLFLSMLIPAIQKRLFFLFKINFHFFSAIFKFFVLKKQSNQWQKLKT